MFDYTMELITLVSSNNFLIFCICNLIIFILLINGLRSESTMPDQESVVFVHSTVTKQIIEKKVQENRGTETLVSNDIEEGRSSYDPKVLDTNKLVIDNHNEDSKGDDDDCIDKSNAANDEEYDDELRRRAEEFIEKINKRWKAEKLATLNGISVI